MNSILNFFRNEKRRLYAQRLPDDQARRAMLCARVNDRAKQTVGTLARERGMSISEYVARMLNDHLTQVSRLRALPGIHS